MYFTPFHTPFSTPFLPSLRHFSVSYALMRTFCALFTQFYTPFHTPLSCIHRCQSPRSSAESFPNFRYKLSISFQFLKLWNETCTRKRQKCTRHNERVHKPRFPAHTGHEKFPTATTIGCWWDEAPMPYIPYLNAIVIGSGNASTRLMGGSMMLAITEPACSLRACISPRAEPELWK